MKQNEDEQRKTARRIEDGKVKRKTVNRTQMIPRDLVKMMMTLEGIPSWRQKTYSCQMEKVWDHAASWTRKS